MQNYVLGFSFSDDFNQVLLIEKDRPDFQKGKLNGLGGKIKLYESPHQAMIREYREECGLVLDWKPLAQLVTNNGIVWVFAAKGDIHNAKQLESESLTICYLSDLSSKPLVPNTQWFIPMAINRLKNLDSAKFFIVKEWYNGESIDALLGLPL